MRNIYEAKNRHFEQYEQQHKKKLASDLTNNDDNNGKDELTTTMQYQHRSECADVYLYIHLTASHFLALYSRNSSYHFFLLPFLLLP
jgi:hypothetical protein